jgi:2'-5' RNA ligase
VRAFIAIDLEEGIKRSLQALIQDLKGTRADIRWVQPGGLHLTLKFLGEIDEAQASRVEAALSKAAARHDPFPLRLEGTGVFPGERNPRVLWVGFAAAPGLLALQEELERALEPEGFAREERAFTPHLTLGRVKGPGHVKDALAVLAKNREKTFGDMTVRRVALFESRLHPEGAEYRIVHEAGLG